MVKGRAKRNVGRAKHARKGITTDVVARAGAVAPKVKAACCEPAGPFTPFVIFTMSEIAAIREALRAPPPGGNGLAWLYPHWMSAARKASDATEGK